MAAAALERRYPEPIRIFVCKALRNVVAKWTGPRHDWKSAFTQFALLCRERVGPLNLNPPHTKNSAYVCVVSPCPETNRSSCGMQDDAKFRSDQKSWRCGIAS